MCHKLHFAEKMSLSSAFLTQIVFSGPSKVFV